MEGCEQGDAIATGTGRFHRQGGPALPDSNRDLALVARIRARGQLTLPVEARRRLSIAEGDRVAVIVRNSCLELIPIDLATRYRRWLLTGLALDGIDAALDDVAPGRVAEIRSARSLEEAVTELLPLPPDHGQPTESVPTESVPTESDPTAPPSLALESLRLTRTFAVSYRALRASGKRHCSTGLHRLLNWGDRISTNLRPLPAPPGFHEYRIGYNDRAIVRLEETTATVLDVFSFAEIARANARAARWESHGPHRAPTESEDPPRS